MAIGKNAINVKKMSETLGKKVKVISERGISELSKFIEDIVEPVTLNSAEISNGVVTVNAGRQSKAALIGRNRAREEELQSILSKFFNINKLKIM
jgi:transcription antitermination factor NusA-like protein